MPVRMPKRAYPMQPARAAPAPYKRARVVGLVRIRWHELRGIARTNIAGHVARHTEVLACDAPVTKGTRVRWRRLIAVVSFLERELGCRGYGGHDVCRGYQAMAHKGIKLWSSAPATQSYDQILIGMRM